MFTQKHFPNFISGDELDNYLERGWFRMGQAVFTCHFLFFEDNLYSPIWVRLPLECYEFRKNLRRLLSRNDRRFRTFIRPAFLDHEKEELFNRYRKYFKGRLEPNLKTNMLDNSPANIFSSYEIAVYDGEKLVAFSFFDVGKSSLASIKAVYDHDYAKYSLGVYTMLKEIQFGLELGFRYFYPGYIVPGYSRFDYKLRVGQQEELQFFNVKLSSWQPFSMFSRKNIPIHQLSHRLRDMAWKLSDFGIVSQIMFYPAYEANIFGYMDERLLESPLFLNLYCNVFPRPRFIIFYDLWKEKYIFCHCMPMEDLGFYFQHAMRFDMLASRHFLDFILKKSLITETDDIQEVLRYAVHIGSLIKPQQHPGFLK